MPKLPNYADSIMGVQKTSCCPKGDIPQHSNYTYIKNLTSPNGLSGLHYVISWKMMTKFQM